MKSGTVSRETEVGMAYSNPEASISKCPKCDSEPNAVGTGEPSGTLTVQSCAACSVKQLLDPKASFK